MRRTYEGSCHCGAVGFTCEIDLAPAGQRSPPPRAAMHFTTTWRCNCSYCTKTRFWKAFVPAEHFRLVRGEASLGDYRFGERAIAHRFCTVCAMHPFATASMDVMGGDFVAVNLACLDDATATELAAAPVRYEDGRNDAWDTEPAITKHM